MTERRAGRPQLSSGRILISTSSGRCTGQRSAMPGDTAAESSRSWPGCHTRWNEAGTEPSLLADRKAAVVAFLKGRGQ